MPPCAKQQELRLCLCQQCKAYSGAEQCNCACAAALEAGKHVICDKPMALNGREAEEMLEAARQHPDQVSTT